MQISKENIAIMADESKNLESILKHLRGKVKEVRFDEYISTNCPFDILVVIGGDGFMLRAMRRFMGAKIKFYGLNVGNIGFLLNILGDDTLTLERLLERIANAKIIEAKPLDIKIFLSNGLAVHGNAINDISFLRCNAHAVKCSIYIDNKCYLSNLVGDGVLVSTAVGSSAYNFSAGGMMIPLDCNALSIVPLCPYSPTRWRGALIPNKSVIKIIIEDSVKRPANLYVDFETFYNVNMVEVCEGKQRITMLFDEGHELDQRIMKAQFS